MGLQVGPICTYVRMYVCMYARMYVNEHVYAPDSWIGLTGFMRFQGLIGAHDTVDGGNLAPRECKEVYSPHPGM